MANNVHSTYSYGAAASGDMHQFGHYVRMNPGRVSLHPLQRTGQVASQAHTLVGAQSAQGFDGIGGSLPASVVDMRLPPVVPITNGDLGRFTV